MAEGEPRESSRIFISYRREDSMGFVRALLEPLRTRFGRSRVFKDTDNISPGQDFVKAIQRELESCKVLLAVIGNEWTTVQDARTGKRRLDNPSDTLRIEISAALRNEQITVIPVLVDRASMPRAEDLPDDLSDLMRRNAFELSDTRWDSDVERLVRAIDEICEAQPQPQPRAEANTASGFERLELKRRRQLAEHLKAAREAFEADDHQAVLAACERAVWLDPQDPEARDLATRAQAAIQQKSIQQRLDQAARALADGDLAAASEAIDHALARSPDHPAAVKLRQDLLRARFERDRQTEVTRQAAAELASAQSSLDEEDFPAALSHVEEALTLAPESREALDLKAKVVAARAESLKQRELKRRAQQAVADAETAWAAGKQDEALKQLSEFSPPHELVSKALEELRAKATGAARLAAAAEAEAAALARRDREAKAAHEAAERQAALAREAADRARRDASAKLALAEAAVKDKRYDAASELVEAAHQIDGGHPDLPEWVTRIADAIAADAAAEQARRDREAQAAREAAERQAALARKAAERARRDADAKLALAATAIEDKRYDAAEKLVDAARLIEPGHPRLAEYAARISDAIAADVAAEQARQEREAEVARAKAAAAKAAADRARRDADAKLALAGAAIDAKRYDAAKKLVDAARVIHPDHPDLASWIARIGDAIESDAAAERARKEQEAEDAAAARAAHEKARRDAKPKVGADQTHIAREAREAEDQPRLGEAKAGPRPAWITYLAAAAAVLVVVFIAASFLNGTDPPPVIDQPTPSTSGGSQVPVPAAPPPNPPSQSDPGKGPNAGADPGSQAPTLKEAPVSTGAGRGTEQTSGTRSSGPETSRSGTGRTSAPAARGAGTSTASRGTRPTGPAEQPTPSGDSPPAGSGTGQARSGGADPPVSPVEPPSLPPVPTVDPNAEAERQKAADLERQKQADIAAIRKLLDAYADAYEDLDDGRLKAIDPGFKGIPRKMLIKKVTVTFQDPVIVVRGPQATVLAPAIYRYEWNRAGNPPTSESRSVTWNLQKDASRWRVVSSN